ncbi:MAG: oligosaccharide flippase family protein [Candidatus Bathyarchaeota archaeon]|nr:oligosaccharide flippase family protein [Candidatus Bathyarchaeum sp.]
MDTATGVGKTSARGGFKLFIGVSISSVITALSLIIVLRLLGNPDDYGLITTALIFPTMLALFKDWGINSAMVKYLAQYKGENKKAKIKNVMVAGMLFELVTGVLLTLLCFFMADFFATNVFNVPEAKMLIELASLTIIADSFLKIAQSTFIGLERLEFHSLTLVLNSCMRCILAPLLVLLGFGVLGALQGQIIAQTIAGIVGLIVFYIKFLSKSNVQSINKSDLIKTLKTMLKYGLPLSISALISGFLPQFYSTLLSQSYVDPNIYLAAQGNYQAAVNFTVVITFFTVPITTVLFPAFSKIKAETDKETLRVMFQSSVKYGALLTLPVALMVMVLSEPLVFAIVGTGYTDAPFFLTLYSISYLYAAVGNLSIANILNGQNKTQTTMKMALVTLGTGVVASLILVPQFKVVGLIVANLIAGAPGMTWGLWHIKKHFGAKVDWLVSAKILLASLVASVVTNLLLSQINYGYFIELIIGGVIFLLVYLVCAPLIRAVNKKDVHSLREMLSGLGPFSPIFNIPLMVIEKLLDIFTF